MSFREEFTEELPTDSAEALCVLGDRAEYWLDRSRGQRFNTSQAEYIHSILVPFIQRQIPQWDAGEKPFEVDYDNIQTLVDVIVKFAAERDAEKLLARYEGENSFGEGENSFGVAELTTDEKQEMHEHLDFIRTVIENSELDSRKKNSLFERINKLSAEIDKVGTRTDQFFGFMSELGFNLGELGKNIKPLVDRMIEMQGTIVKARARTEKIPLPKREDMPQLPAPESEEEDE